MKLFWILFSIFGLAACAVEQHQDNDFGRRSETLSSRYSLETAEKAFLNAGVSFERWSTPRGASSLLVKTSGLHEFNRLALNLERSHFGLKVIYSPSELGNAAAIFDPQNNIIGISHEMAHSVVTDESFAHEMIHADEFASRASGNVKGVHIAARLLKGERMSASSYQAYVRHLSFEEGVAYKTSISKLLNRFEDSNLLSDDELNEIYFAADTGLEVSKVVSEISSRALSTLSNVRIEQVTKAGLPFFELISEIDSIERVFVGGRSTTNHVAEGVRLVHTVSAHHFANLSENSARDLFLESLADAKKVADANRPLYERVVAAMGYVLERVQRREVNFNELNKARLDFIN